MRSSSIPVLRVVEKHDRLEIKGSLPKSMAGEDTTSLLKRETRDYLQHHFLGEAQKILDRKAARIADPEAMEEILREVPVPYLLAYENQEMLHCINLLRKARDVIEQPPALRTMLFVMHEGLLIKCAKAVEFAGHEESVIISGLDLGSVKVVTEMMDFNKDKSVVSINSLPEMIRPVLQKLDKMGLPFLGVFHSHPGGGITGPSSTDLETQTFLEQNYRPLGGVFTNDGYVTFYSKAMDFRVHVIGKTAQQVKPNVWKLPEAV